MLTQESNLNIDPDDGTLFVLVFKWLLELFSVFENPSINCFIRHHGQAGQAVHVVIKLEPTLREREAVDQTRTTRQLAIAWLSA